ncbi:MAG TPA: response regulator, partial [Lachnospiraceae bacterium]|nr:response regulator [Lachnospiraceae bacterium]
MDNSKLKIVILDDNAERRNIISGFMPPYMECFAVPYGDTAKNLIRPDADGRVTDMVIMNADDNKGHGLYMFDWMKTKEAGLGLKKIPVILLTAEEFSERVLDFLEIGDAEFYVGEPDEDKLYSLIMRVFDKVELGPDPKEEPLLYTEERDADKISGLTVKPVGEEGVLKRSIVLSLDEQRMHLEQALERGRKRTEQLRELIEMALRMKEEKKARLNMEQPESIQQKAPWTPVWIRPESQKYASGPVRLGASVYRNMSFIEPLNPDGADTKKTIVIVDGDIRNLKTCELYLKNRYDVVSMETGMQAIDFFVRSKADLLLLSYAMPLLDGLKILESIRWQPNGRMVPVIFMAEGNLLEIGKQCRQAGSAGLLRKPISKSALLGS